jgi:hypothetical protein
MAPPPSVTDQDQPIGERFARALAAKDPVRLKALLRPDVDFRAMTPGRFWESSDIDEIVDDTILGTWFAPDRRITELSSVDGDDLGLIERVGYRMMVTRPDGEFSIEQQAYLRRDGDRISWLRIMCTGFLPVA